MIYNECKSSRKKGKKMGTKIELVFDPFSLSAEIFDNTVGKAFIELLPLDIPLQEWGAELYGPIPWKLPEDGLVTTISPGSLAYSPPGNLFCIFFGQTPAWPVSEIGKINGDEWKKLKSEPLHSVLVRNARSH